jgi:hypothetical protein
MSAAGEDVALVKAIAKANQTHRNARFTGRETP